MASSRVPWGVSMPRHRHWPVTMQAGGVVLRP
ncbi:MAG TPA: alanine acetyltransferase, partial [Cutibacterium acnes]|nr:alanine acetyltransferase [Cutibacterium acnes]